MSAESGITNVPKAQKVTGRRLAKERIYGENAEGRRVLIAAKGAPIPGGVDVPDSKVVSPERAEGTAKAGPDETAARKGPKPARGR